MVKNLHAMQATQVQSLGCEDPLEKGMATDSSVLAWGIPWTEKSKHFSLVPFQPYFLPLSVSVIPLRPHVPTA